MEFGLGSEVRQKLVILLAMERFNFRQSRAVQEFTTGDRGAQSSPAGEKRLTTTMIVLVAAQPRDRRWFNAGLLPKSPRRSCLASVRPHAKMETSGPDSAAQQKLTSITATAQTNLPSSAGSRSRCGEAFKVLSQGNWISHPAVRASSSIKKDRSRGHVGGLLFKARPTARTSYD